MIYDLSQFTDLALFLLRLMVAAVFLASGLSHVRRPKERAESIGISTGATLLLGWVEVLAPIALILGIYVQIAALLLIVVMLGAIYKKAFVWKTGFWGEGSQGWHYDFLLLLANLLFIFTSGGVWTIT